MGGEASPPPSPPPPSSVTYPYSLNFQSSTSVAIIIVVLGATFFFMFLFVLYIKRCNVIERMENDSLTAAGTGGWNRQQHQMIHGLDPEILKKFPIMKFSSVVSTTRPKDSFECAVCLGVFEDSELLRLLPACGHVFHPDCIDMWLQTHSTCPLCRRSLSRDAVSGHLQRALAALTGSIRNSSSNSASPEESTHANPDVEAGHTELTTSTTNNNNTTGHILRALSRNSESFKLASHNLEVQDVRDRIRAGGSSSSGRFGSPTLNRVRSSRSPINPGMMLTPLPSGVMQHSQSFNELSTAAASTSPDSRLVISHDSAAQGEAHSERLRSIPRTMSLSSLRRSFSTSSRGAPPLPQ